MNYQWTGAICVVLACGGFGFSAGAALRRESRFLRQLLKLLDLAEAELSYRLTPLPELCRLLSDEAGEPLRRVFSSLSRELESRLLPDVPSCMAAVLLKEPLPVAQRRLLTALGRSLGCYDLPGQLKQLAALREECLLQLQQLEENREQRIRSYQTLGLCAGAALVILFI